MKTGIQRADYDDLVRRVLDSAPVSRIVLFGSAATGNAGAHSDLDVLAVVPDGTHRRQTANAIYRALWGFPWATDVVVATEGDLERHGDDPALIYRSALVEGKTLYAA